jgi:hypothetical protein
MNANHQRGLIVGVVLLVFSVPLSGCVTGTTIEVAKEHVKYKPQTVDENGKIEPLEVESVEKSEARLLRACPARSRSRHHPDTSLRFRDNWHKPWCSSNAMTKKGEAVINP